MPKSDVTFRTIGFIGNVGSGATFKLYLDNEKTGAKTYHIYFKQLGGSGKLTLTTGVAGASNLTMNVGSYVMIVYVDEFGNVSMQGSGATNTVQSGNNQPVTSNAVAQSVNYTTNESKTGGVFINDKPIYRNVIYLPDTSQMDLTSLNIDMPLRVFGVSTMYGSSQQNQAIPSVGDNGESVGFRFISSHIKVVQNNYSQPFNGTYAVIEYTKTTD